jgi:hypothetical protein
MENNIQEQKSLVSWSERSDSIAKLAAALSKVQAEIEGAKKDSSNPYFNSKYADLAACWGVAREPLAKNELSILQEPATNGTRLILTTTLMHSSGEYVRSSFEIPVVKQDPQGFGSAITYARRYALSSIVGISPEDDDGNAASSANKSNSYQNAAPAPKAPAEKEKLSPKQKATFQAMKNEKSYQYDADKISANYLSEADKKAAWQIAVRDYGAISKDKVIHTAERVDDWYDFLLNDVVDIDDIPTADEFAKRDAARNQ